MAASKAKSRVRVSGKGKRWPKGQCSSSNPTIKKHRDAAKAKGLHPYASVSGIYSKLTVESLATHHAITAYDIPLNLEPMILDRDDNKSSNSAVTFATDWTECTNISFNQFLNNWCPESAHQKEMLAILAATTEVIKSEGGKETETEYLGALLTALDGLETPDQKQACIALINMVMKRVSTNIVRRTFPDTARKCVDLLDQFRNSENSFILKQLLNCLGSSLRQQEAAVWSNESTLQIFQLMLTFCLDGNAKVRHAAQRNILTTLRASSIMLNDSKHVVHPAATTVAKFCIHSLEQNCSVQQSANNILLHTLTLLRNIMGLFPIAMVKECGETILKIMTLGNVTLTVCGFQALNGLFLSRPRKEVLSSKLNAQFIMALYDYEPNVNNAEAALAWLSTMREAHLNLISLDEELCTKHLPKVFATAIEFWLSEQRSVHAGVMACLTGLVNGCVCVLLEGKDTGNSEYQGLVVKLMSHMEGALRYQFRTVWTQVFQVLKDCFKVMGGSYPMEMIKCVKLLGEIRETDLCEVSLEISSLVGAAVRCVGPKVVLEALPLKVTASERDDLSFPRSWLLPVIRDNLQNTQLDFFVSYFLPLASACENFSVKLAKASKPAESKVYEVINAQIWSLLPGFCRGPTDLVTSFGKMARTLGTILDERPSLRMDILAALRNLIAKHTDSASLEEVARYAKNYLPILLNLYTSSNEVCAESIKPAVLETVKSYIAIADDDLRYRLFDKARDKLMSTDLGKSEQKALMDVVCMLVVYMDSDRLAISFDMAITAIKDSKTEKSQRKKCYRLIELICDSASQGSAEFLKKSLGQLKNLLLNRSDEGQDKRAGVGAQRLKCAAVILKKLPIEGKKRKSFALSILPEVILSLTSISEVCRKVATDVALDIIGIWFVAPSASMEESQNELVQLLVAGLAGSNHMIRGTLAAIGCLLKKHANELTPKVHETVVETLLVLLHSESRDLITAVIELLKVTIKFTASSQMIKHVETICRKLYAMPHKQQKHFRFKIRELVIKLIRKFGYDLVSGFIPPAHQKMLANIRKVERRKRKQKEASRWGSDSESDADNQSEYSLKSLRSKNKAQSIDELLDSSSDEEDTASAAMSNLSLATTKRQTSKKSSKKSQKSAAPPVWLQEAQSNGDIVDFLDPSTSRKISATDPDKVQDSNRRTDKNRGFKMAADGRLIITEEEDEDNNKRISAEDRKAAEDIDLNELVEAMSGPKKLGKRKLQDDADGSNVEEPTMKYKAGGSGIHRAIGEKKEFGHEYKAKKARGDLKKKGKPDPYAYVPLNSSTLNKRKRAKFSGQFKTLFSGAKKGALKGMKVRSRQLNKQRKSSRKTGVV